MRLPLRFPLVLAALLAGCSGLPLQPPGQAAAPVPEPAAPIENAAIASLMEGARADAAAGRLANASASIERALRIEPRNPRLWQALARVRLEQGDYLQAENFAARSNAWAGTDGALRAENWRITARSREARGDAEGARAALEAAAKQGWFFPQARARREGRR